MKRSQKHWYSRREKAGKPYRAMRMRIYVTRFMLAAVPDAIANSTKLLSELPRPKTEPSGRYIYWPVLLGRCAGATA